MENDCSSLYMHIRKKIGKKKGKCRDQDWNLCYCGHNAMYY